MSNTKTIKAQILKFTPENEKEILEKCNKQLHDGELVAFPTETVYGLGANALNPAAVLKIFETKGRPLTDPVIVHIYEYKQALNFVDISDKLRKVYEHLAKTFWPGPLTIVAKANDKIIPENVTAKTGFVGIRIPKHPIATKLLQYTKLPIAAPSANRFGHISPTRAEHVLEDLGHAPVLIIDADNSCEVGIESTVVKLEEALGIIALTILRRGGTSQEQLQRALQDLKEKENINVELLTSFKKVSNTTTIGQQAPGQMITHYAPDVQAFMVMEGEESSNSANEEIPLSKCVVIDFGKRYIWTKDVALDYVDLSPSGNVQEAAQVLFQMLRHSEKVEDAVAVLLPNLHDCKDEHAAALFDRIFRAASGLYAKITKTSILPLQPENK